MGSSSAQEDSSQRVLQERTDRPCHVANPKKMREHSSYVPKQMLTRMSESHVGHVASRGPAKRTSTHWQRSDCEHYFVISAKSCAHPRYRDRTETVLAVLLASNASQTISIRGHHCPDLYRSSDPFWPQKIINGAHFLRRPFVTGG